MTINIQTMFGRTIFIERMEYHNGKLFIVESIISLYDNMLIFDVSNLQSILFIDEITSLDLNGCEQLYFPDENTLITTGQYRICFWDLWTR